MPNCVIYNSGQVQPHIADRVFKQFYQAGTCNNLLRYIHKDPEGGEQRNE